MSSGNKADRHFRRVRRRSKDTGLAMRWEYRTKFDLQQEMCDIFSFASPVALIEGSHQSYCRYYKQQIRYGLPPANARNIVRRNLNEGSYELSSVGSSSFFNTRRILHLFCMISRQE